VIGRALRRALARLGRWRRERAMRRLAAALEAVRKP